MRLGGKFIENHFQWTLTCNKCSHAISLNTSAGPLALNNRNILLEVIMKQKDILFFCKCKIMDYTHTYVHTGLYEDRSALWSCISKRRKFLTFCYVSVSTTLAQPAQLSWWWVGEMETSLAPQPNEWTNSSSY